jgi:hypothetical protein
VTTQSGLRRVDTIPHVGLTNWSTVTLVACKPASSAAEEALFLTSGRQRLSSERDYGFLVFRNGCPTSMVEGVVKRRCASGAREPKSRVSVVDSYLPTRNSDESNEYNRSLFCRAPPLCRSFLGNNAEPHVEFSREYTRKCSFETNREFRSLL